MRLKNLENLPGDLTDCVQAFGNALEDPVAAIAENAGLDAADIIAELRHIHSQNTEKSKL